MKRKNRIENLAEIFFNLSINKNETRNGNLKESYIQNNNNNILTDSYPDHYYVCGYPKQLITDYSLLLN
jgi:hypothetical protein